MGKQASARQNATADLGTMEWRAAEAVCRKEEKKPGVVDTRRGEDRTGWGGTYMYIHPYIQWYVQHAQSYLPGERSCDFGSSGYPCGSHMAEGRYEAGLSMGDGQRE